MSGSGKEWSLAGQGAIEGAKMGFALSLGFAVLVWVAITLQGLFNGGSPIEAVAGFFVLLPLVLMYGLAFGGVPSVILGIVTGWITGRFLMRRPSPSKSDFKRIALRVCLAFALPINLFALALFWFGDRPTQLGSFLMYIGFLAVPSVIYVIAGVWMGGRWHERKLRGGASRVQGT
jgi:hypothetical protein